MNTRHPTPEDWMTFLYAEGQPAQRADLQAHLESCAECAARVNIWRSSMAALVHRPAFVPIRAMPTFQPLLKWAAAAVLMLGVGFVIGRQIHQPSFDAETIKAELVRDFEKRLAATVTASGGELQRVVTEFVGAQEAKRSVDQQAIISALQQLDAKYAGSLAALRGELETVALNTQDGLLETHQQLGLLASSAQSLNPEQK